MVAEVLDMREIHEEKTMNRTKIEWADYTWNPIRGLCPEVCKTPDGKSYCYARRMYQRFRMPPDIKLDMNETRRALTLPGRGARIFVCSTIEIFHPAVQRADRGCIFSVIKSRPENTFIILTKRPELIDRPMPDNVWLGVSVTGAEDWYRVHELSKTKARIKFVSLEPFIGTSPRLMPPADFDWLIIGRLTGHGIKNDPEITAVQWMLVQARALNIPIFLKDNLKVMWKGPLIQEYPKEQR